MEGLRNLHLLLGYIRERQEHKDRWVTAFEESSAPYAFIWGRRDPVSGDHILQHLAARLPKAAFTPLDDVGHYPQVEAPDETATALTGFLSPDPAPRYGT
ncbi:alpha/beta fold hydrolase [Actinocorallia herbida]|uniref:alpha/beta fold hydrolase n=1 Tax=Actinocorallia herbida TaxID=58109 RepID=UPI000F4C854A|nr:alpha/beta hydrolase [Actinocorallia herbida]